MKKLRLPPLSSSMPFPPSPGEMIEEEFLKPREMTQTALAREMGVPLQVINGIVQGRRAISPRTAILLSRVLGNTPQFWLNMQNACDLWEAARALDAAV